LLRTSALTWSAVGMVILSCPWSPRCDRAGWVAGHGKMMACCRDCGRQLVGQGLAQEIADTLQQAGA